MQKKCFKNRKCSHPRTILYTLFSHSRKMYNVLYNNKYLCPTLLFLYSITLYLLCGSSGFSLPGKKEKKKRKEKKNVKGY